MNTFGFFAFFIIFTLIFYKVLVLTSSKKSWGIWVDAILTLVASLIYFYVSHKYSSSHTGFLADLMPNLIALGLSIILLVIILWQTLKNKRIGLLIPFFIFGIYYVFTTSVEREEKAKQITFDNFSEKLPVLSQAIDNGDVLTFKKELDTYPNNLNEIDHIMYSKCEWKKQPDICEILLRKKLFCSFCFDDLIVLGLKSKKNKFTHLIPLINQLILESKDKNKSIKYMTQQLTSESSWIRFQYLQSLIKSIGNKPIMIPMDYLEMYLSPEDPRSEEAFLGATKLIINHKSYFFKDEKGLNNYKTEVKKHINQYIENDWKLKQSFTNNLNAILQ